MKKNINIQYKEYHTIISFDDDTKKFSGIIENVDDLIYFECDDEDKIEEEFFAAVDEYIEILEQ